MSYNEYIKHPGLSRSYLLSLAFNPKDDKEKSSTYLDRGQALDLLVSSGSIKFDEVYTEEPVPPTRGDRYKIIKAYLDGQDYEAVHESCKIKASAQDIINCIDLEPAWGRYAKKYKQILEEGKIMLTPEDKTKVYNAYVKLLKDAHTRELIHSLEHEYQIALYGEIDGVLCKGLIDILKVDKVNKEITPYDLKTTSDYTLDFPRSYYKYRYDIQGAFYQELIRLNYPDYKVNNFRFIVVSLEKNDQPYIFEMSDEELFGARNGKTRFDKYYKGYRDLIEDYKYHKKTGNWDYVADYLREGVIVL